MNFEPGTYAVGLTESDDIGYDNTSYATVEVTDTSDVYNSSTSGGGTDCYDVYIEWADGHETYWFSFCCDENHCYES